MLGNAERMEAEAIGVERVVQGCDVALSGIVRITTVEIIADEILPGAIADLHARYPLVTIDVLNEPRSLNLSRREADLAIRMTQFTGNEIVSRRLVTAASGLYVGEVYLAAHGNPLEGEGHAIVTVLEDQEHLPEPRWLVESLTKPRMAMRTNNRSTQLAAVRAGLGVACLPRIVGDAVAGVVLLGEAGPGPEREVWLGVHGDLRHMPRIRVVIDALESAFARAAGRFMGPAAA